MAYSKTPLLVSKFNDWDIATCLYFNHFCHQRAIQRFFSVISRLGDGVLWYSFALVLPLLFGFRGLLVTVAMAFWGGVCLFLYRQLKHRLVRERPFIRSKDIFRGCAPLDQYSFPSGHTMHAVCFSTIILGVFPFLWPLLITFTVLVGLSRMILGLHYPSDVVCGAGIGYVIGAMGSASIQHVLMALTA